MINQRAYAKINLGLRILRKRGDGYHDIETVFQSINLYDEITLEPSDAISLTCSEPTLPTDERNLCMKSAISLNQFSKIQRGVHIHLRKQIPVGAGLGGGSSDAAATLHALNRFWDLELGENELYRIALKLGSDVPYFLKKGTAYATGRGEELEYIPFDIPYWIVVAYPNIHISTTWAYQNINFQQLTTRPHFTSSLKRIAIDHINDPQQLVMHLGNDFEPLVLRTYPLIAKVRQTFYSTGAVLALLSGSGSAVFALYSREFQAQAAAQHLRKSYQVFITPPHFQPEE